MGCKESNNTVIPVFYLYLTDSSMVNSLGASTRVMGDGAGMGLGEWW